ncbi:GTPase ObgE [bacterium]|nr:MAG: GTPase ObgE [bacterium]
MFIDEATITVKGGDGGDGIVAWRREKYVPKGGPAGGDGGQGGSVILVADPNVNTLVEFRYKRQFAARDGEHGGTSNKSGRSAPDLLIPVPVGTLIIRDGSPYADLGEPGKRVPIAKGGRGGLGNQHFATARRQAPHYSEKGEPGEEHEIALELRLLADVGIVGVPNAGKSTLLSVISAAKPKIADYPFTTLEPQLGVVRLDEETSFVAVDVPGLVEGAHEGAGLGDRFLRHVQRTRVLIHLIDGMDTPEQARTERAMIESELRESGLIDKPRIVVISKMDLPQARETFAALRQEIPGLMAISSATSEGVRELMYAAWRVIQETPAPRFALEESPRIDLTPSEPFHVERDGGVFVVSGPRVERLASMTDFDNDEALGRFERALDKLGVERRLRDLGIAAGDTVRIGDAEFEYS